MPDPIIRLSQAHMKEAEIKKALEAHLVREGRGAALLEELELSGGKVRADVVDVTEMHCYEIKSHSDSLSRLLGQGVRYNWVFDHITLITAERHLKKALVLLPDWWGVMVIGREPGSPLCEYRAAQTNVAWNALQLGRVLKREECLDFFSKANQLKGKKSKNLSELQALVVDHLELAELKLLVKRCLTLRAERARAGLVQHAQAATYLGQSSTALLSCLSSPTA